MSRSVLILLAHPAAEKSLIHRCLSEAAASLPHVTLHALYEHYPDFKIDVPREQALLRAHDTVLMQHPLYWYSSPALLKQWQDAVLDYGFAYGEGGTVLHGKFLQQVVTTGGAAHAFTGEGDSCTIEELLRPFEQTARKCGMAYLPPYVIHAAGRMDEAVARQEAERYRDHLHVLAT